MPTKERIKVSQACEACRHKKIKCDDLRPVCANCVKASIPCHRMAHSPSSTGSRKRSARENREMKKRKASFLPLAPRPPEKRQHIDHAAPVRTSPVADGIGDRFSSPTEPAPDGEPMIGELALQNVASSFFGGSSAPSFMRQIQNIIDARTGKASAASVDEHFIPALIDLSASDEKTLTSRIFGQLPSRNLSDDLLAAYWDLVHPLCPFLDRTQIEAVYNLYCSEESTKNIHPLFGCLLLCMFAVSCQCSEVIDTVERRKESKRLFTAAQSYLVHTRSPSISGVQCYLLMAQYLQSVDDHQQCWVVTGLAVRMAQSMGFHLPETSEQAPSQRSRELLRRVWHACVLTERITGTACGGPLIVHKSMAASVRLPEPDAEDPEPDIVHFFTHSVKLFRLFSFVMLRFYASHPSLSLREGDLLHYLTGTWISSPVDGEAKSILLIDRDLAQWRRDLPIHLAKPPPPSASGIYNRQSVVLLQRYVHIKILMTRPIMAAFVAGALSEITGDSNAIWIDKDTLTYALAYQSSSKCVKYAEEAITIVNDRLVVGNSGSLSERWFNTTYIYTAATVLLAAQVAGDLFETILTHSFHELWSQAIFALQNCQSGPEGGSRLLETLHVLREKVLARPDTQHSGPIAMDEPAQRPQILDSLQQGYIGDATSLSTQDYFNSAVQQNDLSWLTDVPFFSDDDFAGLTQDMPL